MRLSIAAVSLLVFPCRFASSASAAKRSRTKPPRISPVDDVADGLNSNVSQINIRIAALSSSTTPEPESPVEITMQSPPVATKRPRRLPPQDVLSEEDAQHRRRQLARVMKDDFWDDDHDTVDSPPSDPSKRMRKTRTGTSSRSTNESDRSERRESGPASSLSAPVLLEFDLVALIEQVPRAIRGDNAASHMLYQFGFAKSVGTTSESAAISLLHSWLKRNIESTGGVDDTVSPSDGKVTKHSDGGVDGFISLCTYYASQSATVAQLRLTHMLLRAVNDFLTADSEQCRCVVSSGNEMDAALFVGTLARILFEIFDKSLLQPKRAKCRELFDEVHRLKQVLRERLCVVSETVVLRLKHMGGDEVLGRRDVHLPQRARLLFEIINYINVVANDNPETTQQKDLLSLQQTGLDCLVATCSRMLLTAKTDSDLCCVLDFCAHPLDNWLPSARKQLRSEVARCFGHICEQQGNEDSLFQFCMSPRVLGAVEHVAKVSKPCWEALSREILRCASKLVVSSKSTDDGGKDDVVFRVVKRLLESGMPMQTLLASQFCTAMKAPQLLSILRLQNSGVVPSGMECDAPEKVPEILSKTLISSMNERVVQLRHQIAHSEPSGAHDALTQGNNEDIRDSCRERLHQVASDCVQLFLEFSKRDMRAESTKVVQQLVAAVQLAEKIDPDAGFCFMVEHIRELGVLLQRQSFSPLRSKVIRECLGEMWNLTISKLNDTINVVITNSLSKALANREDRANVVQSIMEPLQLVVAVSCSVGGSESVKRQLFRHVASLSTNAELTFLIDSVLGGTTDAFISLTTNTFGLKPGHDSQMAAKLYQLFIQEVLRSNDRLSSQSSEWGHSWNSAAPLIRTLRVLCASSFSIEAEDADTLRFRNEVLTRVLSEIITTGDLATVSDPSILLAIAEVTYVQRSAHVLSDDFDILFSKQFVAMLHKAQGITLVTEPIVLQILSLSSAILQKGTEKVICRWQQRFDETLQGIEASPSLRSGAATFGILSYDSIIAILRSLLRHETLHSRLRTSIVKLIPHMKSQLPNASIRSVVDCLRCMVSLGVSDADVCSEMLQRILNEADRLDLGDCGDVVGMVPNLARCGHDAALTLPSALEPRVQEHRFTCDAAQVSRIVRGFASLQSNESRGLRERVLTGLILRCMQVIPMMKPDELLATLEGYLSIHSVHMSLLGVLLARVSDCKDAFSLPQTVRLVSSCVDAAKYDARVSKACITAAHPVFLTLVQHLLKNDVLSLVVIGNNAELILNCLSAAFFKEAISDDVLRAVASHCKTTAPGGILAALRLIAKRGSADFTAANIIFQHCMTSLIPSSSPLQLAELTLALIQCGIRTASFLHTHDARLQQLCDLLDANALSILCEAHLLARRDDPTTICNAICRHTSTSSSLVLTSLNVDQLMLVFRVLTSSHSVIPREHLLPLRNILDKWLDLKVPQMSVEDGAQILKLLMKVHTFAGTSISMDVIKRIATHVAASMEHSVSSLGSAFTSTDLGLIVESLYCLANLGIFDVPLHRLLLPVVLGSHDTVRQRHVLQTKVSDVVQYYSESNLETLDQMVADHWKLMLEQHSSNTMKSDDNAAAKATTEAAHEYLGEPFIEEDV